MKQLNKFLKLMYPETMNQSRPKEVIDPVISFLLTNSGKGYWVYSGDIKKFFDSVPHKNLIESLRKRIHCKEVLSLIQHACQTPTLPINTTKKLQHKYKSDIGIPQGLSIAGTLASIYMMDIDEVMKIESDQYYYTRYVDDILMIGKDSEILKAKEKLTALVKDAKLELHTNEKEQLKRISEPFQYLGYYFKSPGVISVRKSSVDQLRKNILKTINSNEKKEDVIRELNFKITGFLQEGSGKYFGWLSYYNSINDLSLLYELDNFVKNQTKRICVSSKENNMKIKSFVRAYYESKHSLFDGYIPTLPEEKIFIDDLE